MLSGFQNVELPCDWTVNRRPTQSSSAAAAAAAQQDGCEHHHPHATDKTVDDGGRSKPKQSSGKAKKQRQSVKAPPQAAQPRTAAFAVASATTTTVPTKSAEKEDSGGVSQSPPLIDPHPLGPLSTVLASAPASTVVVVPSPMTQGGCPAATHNNNNNATASGKNVRQRILKHLEQAPHVRTSDKESAEEPLTTLPEPIDTEGLLSRLPYKKMLSDMFGGNLRGNMQSAVIPYVTRAYEEAFMREPNHSNERECARGKQCECMYIDRTQAFVGVEFLLPGEAVPRTPHLCVLCCRATTQQLYYDVMFDKVEFPGCIQRYGNIHSEPGEYSLDAMLIAVQTAPVHVMPLPIVSHQRNRYSVRVAGGIKHLKQSRVHFRSTPSCSADSGI